MYSIDPQSLLNEWKTNSALLRVVAGVSGLGFDTLCKIKELSSDKMLLVWDEGDSVISLIDASFGYREISEDMPERRLSEEDECTRQLILLWPEENKMCILFEQREPS